VVPPAPATGEVAPALAHLPEHVRAQLLGPEKETAQRYYSRFRETRAELIQRLLDPPLTLEETARILNVCPMTVRRYTNRGVLPHFRTGGDQRRFRLSDVLAFMERQGRLSGDE
jgi:excisionase family DNA binding protein